jgi:heat shock protein HslJ
MERSPTRSLALLVLVTVLATTLAGCIGGPGGSGGPGASGGGPGASAPRVGLDGRTFLSTAVDGRILVAGSQVRLGFEGGAISASAGCNSMSGTYAVDGGTLVARSLATTEMGCDPALMAQDAWLADLLTGATIGLDGDTLMLTKAGVRVTLVDRVVADPDRPLVGTRWVLDGIASGSAVSSVPVGVTATVTFTDGRVDVEAGCNHGGGAVKVSGSTLDFGVIGLTKMACEAPAMAVERAVVAVLSGTATYTVEAGRLTVANRAGGLIFRAA